MNEVMNDFAINDTFDNFSFTTSGHLVARQEVENENKNINTKKYVQRSLKVSFDDSAYLNDSLSFSAVNNLSHILKDDSKANATDKCMQSKSKEDTNKKNGTPMKNENGKKSFGPLEITVNKGTPQKTQNTSKVLPPTIPKSSQVNSLALTDSEIFKFSQSGSNKLSVLGLPTQILQKYECRNVVRMFPWQLECLACEGVLEDAKNLVYSAPTSAGKTLVAEVLAIKTVLERKKKVIFILPFVSVVREKMFYFQDIFGSSGIRVEGFMGSYNPAGGFKSVNVAICTIERANSLINRLLEAGQLAEIGAVIVDELHLLGDPGRGYLLELLLTKLRYASLQDTTVRIQLVGMSATLPNLELLGRWLDAALYVTTFRPIPLNEQCLVAGDIYNSQLALERRLEAIPELDTDTDHVLQLCLETVLNRCSVLIFCPTKNWCENLAVQIATAFYKLGTSKSPLGLDLRTQLRPEPIVECLEQLKRSPSGLDQVLHKTVSFGVAFHHAGLTMDERDIIEGAFRDGTLKVLVATSTLSSGVNLPARRVIIRTPTFFGKPIDVLSYKQMVGRAGRMGKDTAGESILICQKSDLKVARQLITGRLDAISSCLDDSGRLKRALLEIIAAGVASTPDEIETFGDCTMLSQEGDIKANNPLGDALDFLIKFHFVRLQVNAEGTSLYVATPLAKACLNSSMPPEEGLELLAELEKARQCFVLETELHLVYLVTPYTVQLGTIDWMQYLELWEKLSASMKRVGDLVGIKLSFIINCTRGKTSTASGKLAVHRRFYTALALQDLVNEMPLAEVAHKFNCNRGALQGLQQTAATFAGRVTAFSKQLGWSSVELLISQFQDRLQFGVSRELLDLMRLPVLNGQRARVLFNFGIESVIDLAACDVYALENALHKAQPFESKEREGESSHEADKRHRLRTIFITGKQGLTELEAAKMMVEDARRYLQFEIGLSDAHWAQERTEHSVDSPDKISAAEEQTSRKLSVVQTTCGDSLSNTSLNTFEISASPSAINTRPNSCSPAQDQLNQFEEKDPEMKTNNNESCESLFNDSFECEMQNNISRIEHEEKLDKQIHIEDSLLTNAFLNSFNESLSLSIIDTEQVKRTSDEMFSSNSSSNDEISEDFYRKKTKSDIFNYAERKSCSCSFDIIKVSDNSKLYDAFFNELMQQETIALSLGCEKYEEEKQVIGLRRRVKPKENYTWKSLKVVGLGIYWPQQNAEKTTYFVDFESGQGLIDLRKLETEILRKKLRIFNCKEQLKLLHSVLGWQIDGVKCEDPKVGDWLLDADAYEKDLRKMVRTYIPNLEDLLDLGENRREAKVRGCLEALVNWSLMREILSRLIRQDPQLLHCYEQEMHVVIILTKMELNGFPCDLKSLQLFADSLQSHLKSIEVEAFQLAGRRFSFASSAAVAKVLQMQVPRRGGRKPSTNKQALGQHANPLAELIIQWRKLNNTLTKMVYPLLRCIDNGRIHGTCVTHTATGRVSMHEPNLQNVPRDFEFRHSNISVRSAFRDTDTGVIVAADYCQLELRLLAHLSRDTTLCEIMRGECDIFKSIAAKWMKIQENDVDATLRQQTKQICYGIIYGIGTKTLADQMSVTESEAAQFIESFHCEYPGIRRFIAESIGKCQQVGFVETLLGRRRFLPMIRSTNVVEKGKAERQAVNSTVQGSAADIAKKAMIAVDQKLRDKFRHSRHVPKLILQLHDELLYQVQPKYVDIFARILKKCMQECVELSVPLPVVVQSGKSWGGLAPRQ